jgi:F-box protein 11
MLCPSCHKPCSPVAQFCPHCGARLGNTPNESHDRAAEVSSYMPSGVTPSAAVVRPLPPGTLLQGRYRIGRVLGTGAFGRVYLAEDAQHGGGSLVAIKELLDAQFASPQAKRDAIAWFKREVGTLLTLDQRGIPAIHGYWTAEPAAGPFYLAMDYIPGMTLQEALHHAGGPLPWPQVVAWGIALCEMLAYLHGQTPPFIFRDLKPSNIMLDSGTNLPVLIDFGIARRLAASSGTAIGTWGYMPYEQMLGKAEPRSDLYALGATLHALLTGQSPDEEYQRLQRDGRDVEGTMRALFPSADTLASAVPAPLARVVERVTAFVATDRFDSAMALADALRQASQSDVTDRDEGLVHMASASAAPSAPSMIDGPSLVVSAHGEGQYTSIAEAVHYAAPGTRIEVQPGHYPAVLVLDKKVEIVGMGRPEDIVVETANAACLVMWADEAVVRRLTLRAGPGGAPHYAVDIPQGALMLEDCVVTSASLAGVAIHGAAATPTLRRCTIHDGQASGVVVYEGGLGLIEDCTITGTALAGVEITAGGNPTLRRCTIRDGHAGGVVVHGQGQGAIEECTIHGNTLAGIEIRQQSAPAIRRCTIRDGHASGVLVSAHGQGVVEDCEVNGNALAGVEIAQGSTPTIRRCTIRAGQADGVLVYADGQGLLEDCAIVGSALAGVEITQGGAPLLRRCTIGEGKQGGVLIYDGGRGTVEECTVSANALAGLEIGDGGNVVVRHCHINRNGHAGVFAFGHATLRVESCDLTGNVSGAWHTDPWCQVYGANNVE